MVTDINNQNIIRECTKIEMSLKSRDYTVAILVESPSNEKLFKVCFSEKCKFFPLNGWEYLIAVINHFSENNSTPIIGIIDADFKRINNSIPSIKNLFLTDHHDTEIMMIMSEAWNQVLHRIGDSDKIQKKEFNDKKSIRDSIFEIITPIGIMRLLNDSDNLGLKFKSQVKDGFKYIDYDLFIDKTTLKFDEKKMLKAIENRSEKPDFFKQNPALYIKFKELYKQDFDLKELCNGHDFLNILSISIEKCLGNKYYKPEALEELFIVAYRFEDFKLTNLYQELLKWEKENIQVLNV